MKEAEAESDKLFKNLVKRDEVIASMDKKAQENQQSLSVTNREQLDLTIAQLKERCVVITVLSVTMYLESEIKVELKKFVDQLL
jgi:hypothetical protein